MTDPIARLNAALQGRYRVERQLGEGGMATVYLADDLKHGRKVALKVLKPELSAIVGAERFLAEIRTTASLQHPHILPLFDSGEADKLLFYAMPHVEGESLRERLDREHQLPVDEAVRIATNVAEALDYAHARGVIHRDIKPANILLHAGKPVISDFGIALAVTAGGAGRMTETGLSLGTPHYMSPEQATGEQSVGPATDIWAIGCVLYEMLVGEPPYTGSTPQAVLGKIVLATPASATEARKSVPANVDAAIRKALEKVAADRFGSASDFVRALADGGFRHGADAASRVGAGAPAPWNRWTMGFAAAAAVFALTTLWLVMDAPPSEPRQVARFNVTPREDQRIIPANGVDFAVSPDGSRFVYVGPLGGGGRQLWQRVLEDLEAVPIAGTDGAAAPAFSPDGRSVAFSSGGAIRTVSLLGGPPVTVASGGGSALGTPEWGPDGMIYFVRDATVVYRVAAGGGDPTAITVRADVELRWPAALPGGHGLLVTSYVGGAVTTSRIAVVGPEGGEVREILTGTMARYAPSGHLVYVTEEGTLWAAPFDLGRLEVTGPSVSLVEGVNVKLAGAPQFALSESGTLLYRTGERIETELVWVNRAGQAQPVDPEWTGDFGMPAISPDAARLAIALYGGGSWDLWVKQLDRGPSTRLTFEGIDNDDATWTRDGASLTYYSNQNGSQDLWTTRANGSGEPVLEIDAERGLRSPTWSPDGEWLVFATSRLEAEGADILALRAGEDSTPRALVATQFAEQAPTLSPDGRWMAYSSDETGRREIYVVPFPNAGGAKWTVSTGGGSGPLWSRTGQEIFYRNRQGEMVAVRVDTNPTFTVGGTSVLFSATDYLANPENPIYDVTPDGERFIMLRRVGSTVEPQLILVLNWFEELRARAPDP